MSQNFRTLQIHVTRKCNLKCLHCYSMSGPDETEVLEIEALKRTVTDASHLGYNVVSLSGGEPFLYTDMGPLLAHAKTLGQFTATVTNGMFLDARRLEALRGSLDLCVISLDGAPERHNKMRANPHAFEVMSKKLPHLRDSGIPFGFIFTLADDNAHEIDWAADFAAENGASMLQIHPLDMVGRALEHDQLDGKQPEQATALLAAKTAYAAKQRLGDALNIVVDYQPRMPEEMRAMANSCGRTPQFADKVYPLCIETNGSIVPIGHGFNDDYALGHITDGRLLEMAHAWETSGQADRYADLINATRDAADAPDAPELKNLAQAFLHASLKEAAIAAE